MANTNNELYKELPYYSSSNKYRPSFKISRRKILIGSNVDNYLTLIEKTELEKTYFYTDNLQRIIKTSLKLEDK